MTASGVAQGTGVMEEHSLTWIFAVGMIFAFLDAFGIGANDVANSFATSVGSRVLTLRKACCIALFTEFLGAVMLGAQVTGTIRNGIISVKDFNNRPDLFMFAMMCAMIGSSLWVLLATRFGMPVSTTHAIVGAIMGVGIVCFGWEAVNWGWSGVGKILASFVISPILAGCMGAIIFLFTKYTILVRENSFKRALILTPFYAFVTTGIVMAFWVTKGSPQLKLDQQSTGVQCAIIFGTTAVVTAFATFVMVPFMYKRAKREEEEMKAVEKEEHVMGDHAPASFAMDADSGLNTPTEVDNVIVPASTGDFSTVANAQQPTSKKNFTSAAGNDDTKPESQNGDTTVSGDNSQTAPLSAWQLRKTQTMNILNRTILSGVNKEVVEFQKDKMHEMHEAAVKYPGKTERVFSWLQVCTASMASFSHGANDVANAVGPVSGVFYVWQNGTVPGSKSPVPTWILAYGGVGIQLGLLLYGYNIMRSLGNNITYHSPSRGFSMELGAVLTVLLATYLAIPVSTTHCITGSTVAVGLCNGKDSLKAINWKMVVWCMFGWLLTLPIAGGVAALALAFGAGAPNFGPGYPDPVPS